MWSFKVYSTVLVVILVIAKQSGSDSLDDKHYKSSDYTFSYGVKDLHTGDIKQQWEKKDGDTVSGHYTIVEPDGSIRTVHYTADDKNGFNAVVKRSGPSHHPETILPVKDIHHNYKEPTSHSNVNIKPKKQEVKYVEVVEEEQHNTNHHQQPEQENVDHESVVNDLYQAQQDETEYGPEQSHYDIQGSNVVEKTYNGERQKENYGEREHYGDKERYGEKEHHSEKQRYEENERYPEREQPEHETDEKATYVYLPVEEVSAEKHSVTATKYVGPKYHNYQSEDESPDTNEPTPKVTVYKELESNYPNYITKPKDFDQKENQKPEISYGKMKTHLPVDLSLVQKDSSKIPVDVSLLLPIEIDLTHLTEDKKPTQQPGDNKVRYATQDSSVEASHELTQKELNNYVNGYYKNTVNEPFIETGFKPMTTKPNLITQPIASALNQGIESQTYTSNKKPMRTPGLRNFATPASSKRNNVMYRSPKYQPNASRGANMAAAAERDEMRKEIHKAEYTRILRSNYRNRGAVRYAQRVHIDEE